MLHSPVTPPRFTPRPGTGTGTGTDTGIRAAAIGSGCGILADVLRPDRGLAIWSRPGFPDWAGDASRLLAGPDLEAVAENRPDQAAASLAAAVPGLGPALLADIALLAGRFAALTGGGTVRLRFERLCNDACSCFHVDRVGLRLLCTYAGPGTEWQDAGSAVRRLRPGDVAVLKGSLFPDAAPRVPHRSPPVEHLPADGRARLLLVIDQPGVF